MFYSYDLLKKRGKFGIIWLAATSPSRLNKRDLMAVNVPERCDDVLNVITNGLLQDIGKKTRFSLYLSSQLMYGLVYINQKLNNYLLEDTRIIYEKILKFKMPSHAIVDLSEVEKPHRITFPPPDFNNIPLDFGRLDMEEIVPVYTSAEFFLVSTPQSSEESEKALSFEDAQTLHVVDPELITIPEITPTLQPIEEESGNSSDFRTRTHPFSLAYFFKTSITRKAKGS